MGSLGRVMCMYRCAKTDSDCSQCTTGAGTGGYICIPLTTYCSTYMTQVLQHNAHTYICFQSIIYYQL